MARMGEMYRHAYFTMFAVSGNDSYYGLPGVRPDTRRLKQLVREVSGLSIANSLPWIDDHGLLMAGAWGSRAWTFQERFNAQRSLFLSDYGAIFNYKHTYSSGDEHCSHPRIGEGRDIATGDMVSSAGQDKRCEPYLKSVRTGSDDYARYVCEYTQRKMTYQ